MNSNLVSEADLKSWLGYERRADIESWLRQRGISYWPGRGGCLCTTVAAINAARAANADSFDDFEFANGPQPSH